MQIRRPESGPRKGHRIIEDDNKTEMFSVTLERECDGDIFDGDGQRIGYAKLVIRTPSTEIELWKMAARRAADGATGIAKAALRIDMAEPEIVAARLAICEQCELSQPQNKPVAKRKCGKLLDLHGKGCGCWIDKKTRVGKEKCPLDKW